MNWWCMFKVITKEETEELLKSPLPGDNYHGSFTARMMENFSAMSVGESFIFPFIEGKTKSQTRDKVKGTCRNKGVKIATKSLSEGLLVIYLGMDEGK